MIHIPVRESRTEKITGLVLSFYRDSIIRELKCNVTYKIIFLPLKFFFFLETNSSFALPETYCACLGQRHAAFPIDKTTVSKRKTTTQKRPHVAANLLKLNHLSTTLYNSQPPQPLMHAYVPSPPFLHFLI